MNEVQPDARTTPQWLRIPMLVICIALASVFYSAWYETKDDYPSTWISRHYPLYWMANWSMFTNRNRTQRALDVEMYRDEEWKRINMARWFPTRWESGLRFDRRSFLHNSRRMRTLAAATCGRMDAHPNVRMPDKLRFTEVKWRKTLGSKRQKRRRRVEKKTLLEWTCGDKPPFPPKGRRL